MSFLSNFPNGCSALDYENWCGTNRSEATYKECLDCIASAECFDCKRCETCCKCEEAK